MLVIDLSQAIDLAYSLEIDVEEERQEIDALMESIGLKLAAHLAVDFESAGVEETAFGGACLCFTSSTGHFPLCLQELDPEGE